mmetsp:Transcript_60762/g.177513  ORF Transcript_60762/g.177513 Transcript_60762/m.177513 type:complete len:208 (-) Transcript_60762:730-1353(-)
MDGRVHQSSVWCAATRSHGRRSDNCGVGIPERHGPVTGFTRHGVRLLPRWQHGLHSCPASDQRRTQHLRHTAGDGSDHRVLLCNVLEALGCGAHHVRQGLFSTCMEVPADHHCHTFLHSGCALPQRGPVKVPGDRGRRNRSGPCTLPLRPMDLLQEEIPLVVHSGAALLPAGGRAAAAAQDPDRVPQRDVHGRLRHDAAGDGHPAWG